VQLKGHKHHKKHGHKKHPKKQVAKVQEVVPDMIQISTIRDVDYDEIYGDTLF
jgi:hypothetical protein